MPSGWRDRVAALRNIPPLLQLVRETSLALAVGSLVLRLVSALLPVAMLYVARLIIDQIVGFVNKGVGDSHWVWVLLATEASLAVVSDLIGRLITLLDS